MIYQICTHHRCGTVLMMNTFRLFGEATGRGFFKGKTVDLPKNVLISQSAHSRADEVAFEGDLKGVHLYRDPFKMLMSHIKYHQITESPSEPSTYRLINGQVYKEVLKGLSGIDNKAYF